MKTNANLARILQDLDKKYKSCKILPENIFLARTWQKKYFLQESCKILARNTSNQNFDEKFEVAWWARPFWICVGKTSCLYFLSHLSVFCINYAPWVLGYGQNICSGTIPIVETMSGLNSTGYTDRKRTFPGDEESDLTYLIRWGISCKNLARWCISCKNLARNLPEKCIVLQDLARHLARFLQDLYFFSTRVKVTFFSTSSRPQTDEFIFLTEFQPNISRTWRGHKGSPLIIKILPILENWTDKGFPFWVYCWKREIFPYVTLPMAVGRIKLAYLETFPISNGRKTIESKSFV